MTKNKFIKCLKIIAVLGPLVFNLLLCVIGFFGSTNILTRDTVQSDISVITRYTSDFVNEFVDTTNEVCFMPYITLIVSNSNGITPIIEPMANFMTQAFVGADFANLLDVATPPMYSLLGLMSMVLFYLMIEIIFFIPEVILLFIRWAKNLVYAFTKKGGFDA